MKRIFAAASVLLAAAAMAYAGIGLTDWLRPSAVADHEAVPQGGTLRVAVVLDIDPGYHVYSNPPSSPDFIPVVVEPQPASHIRWGAVRYPPGKTLTPKTSIGQTVSVYTGRTIVLVDATVADDAPPGDLPLAAETQVPGLQRGVVFPAGRSRPCRRRPDRAPRAQPPCLPPPTIFAEADRQFASAPPQAAAVEGGIDLAATFENSFLLYLGVLLLGGLALNLTPCVFPLIPVTMTVFAQQGESRPARVLPLAVLYVLGLAATFTLVGVLAALAGKSMGVVLTQPVGVLAVVVVLAVMMASTFGAFEIRLPSGLAGRLGGRRGMLGAAFMGMVMGAVAAPCVGPFLFALITFVAATQSVALGAISFFVVGLGLGLPFLVLGLFTSQINRFPRSGGWLIWVKQADGPGPGRPDPVLHPAVHRPGFLLAAGAGRTASLPRCTWGSWRASSRRPFSRTFWAVAARRGRGDPGRHRGRLLGYETPKRPEVKWTPWQAGALEAAKAEGKPVLLYFGADWCIACKEWHAGSSATRRSSRRPRRSCGSRWM